MENLFLNSFFLVNHLPLIVVDAQVKEWKIERDSRLGRPNTTTALIGEKLEADSFAFLLAIFISRRPIPLQNGFSIYLIDINSWHAKLKILSARFQARQPKAKVPLQKSLLLIQFSISIQTMLQNLLLENFQFRGGRRAVVLPRNNILALRAPPRTLAIH